MDGRVSIFHTRRPGPGNTDWQDEAACRNAPDPNLFFPEIRTGGIKRKVKQAKNQYCARCPVQQECLEYANNDPWVGDWGVWGGMTVQERRKIRQNNRQIAEEEVA